MYYEKIRLLRKYARAIIAFIIMLIFFLIFFIIDDNNWRNLSISVISASLIIMIYEIFSHTFEEKFIFEYLPMFKESQQIGLKKVVYKPIDTDEYKKNLLNSYKLIVVMNDGKTFLRNYYSVLESRMHKKGLTEFILLNPNSQFVEFLSKRNEKETKDYYKSKIRDVIKNLKEISQNKKKEHEFSIYIHDGFHPYAVVMCDDKAMVSMYRLSPGKHEVLHFLFEYVGRDCEYEKIKQDIENLKKRAKLIN